jgi:DNA-directed RNA polymerase beta subunit
MSDADNPQTPKSYDELIANVKMALAVGAPGSKKPSTPSSITGNARVDEDIFGDTDYVPVGLGGILAATEKLLHVNQGVIDPDDRDAAQFKRFYQTSHLLRERIRLDSEHVKRNLIRYAARQRNLKPVHAGIFDGYATGHLIGNPLSSPLEEINPMHILEQARRVTQMGPGGVSSDDSISEGMNAVKGTEFGFVDQVAGPESGRAGVDVRAAWGTKYGKDGRIYQRMRDTKTGKTVWVSPEDLDGKIVAMPD